jgi:predicted permease
MLARIFAVIFPLFAIALVGYLYGRRHRIDMTVANRLNTDVFLPALIFGALASKTFEITAYSGLALGAALVVLGSGVVGWLATRPLKIEWRTLVPPMMFSNAGNLGIPLVVLAFGEQALAGAIVLFLVETILHTSLGNWWLSRRLRVLEFVRIPVIVATLAGLTVSLGGVALPDYLITAIRMLGEISIPLMLFALGVRLTDASWRYWQLGVIGALLGPAGGLLIAALAMPWLGLSLEQERWLWVFAALPPAVLNFIFAEQYRQEPDKVAAIVMIGNVGTLVVMPVVLALVLA